MKMGLWNWLLGKRTADRPSPFSVPPRVAPQPGEDDLFEVDKPDVRFVLPGGIGGVPWSEEAIENGWSFTHRLWGLEATASVRPTAHRFPLSELRGPLEKLAHVYQDSFARQSTGPCEFGQVQWMETADELRMRFSGSAVRDGTSFAVLSVGRPAKVVTLTLIQHPRGLGVADFQAVAGAVFNTFVVKE
jgi:hypothetical protein